MADVLHACICIESKSLWSLTGVICYFHRIIYDNSHVPLMDFDMISLSPLSASPCEPARSCQENILTQIAAISDEHEECYQFDTNNGHFFCSNKETQQSSRK